ncbi:MAG: ubiquitin [Armatimonadetes bacterium]|nr:ubiquitin [Armatimonadota bacterium]
MSVDLAKVDQLRERIHCSYEEARNALEATGGDVVAALARLEQSHPRSIPPDTLAVTAELVEDVIRLLEAGPIRGVRIRLGGRILKEIPIEATAVGAILIGLLATLAARFTIELIRDRKEE